MIRRAVFCVVAVALLVGIAGQVVAGEDTESRLQFLEQQLRAQEQEILQLREALAEQQVQDESIGSEIDQYFSKAGGEADLQSGWNDGLQYVSADKAFTLKIGGRVFIDYAFTDPNTKWKDYFSNSGTYTSVYAVSQARIHMAGDIYKNTFFKAEFEFAGQAVTFQDVWIGLKNVPVVGHIKVGNYRQFFSIGQLTKYTFLSFTERAMAVQAFAPQRALGVGFYNTELDGTLFWGIGLFNAGNGGALAMTGNNIPARVAWAPIMEEGKLLQVGISYAYIDNDTYNIMVNPENVLTVSNFGTGTFSAKANHRFGVEVAGRFGPFHFTGEWIWSMYDKASTGGQRNDVTLNGGYIEGGWFITGEERGFANSIWDRTTPNANFYDGNGGNGAWEVVARFSWLDLKDKIVQGDQAWTFSLGLNWYWNPNTRFMFNYVYCDHDEVAGSSGTSGGTINQFLFRLQIDW